MIETIALIINAISLMAGVLGVVWVYRCKHCLKCPIGLFALTVLTYATWHFVAHLSIVDSYSHLIIHNAFVIVTAGVNAFYACRTDVTLNLNRRKENKPCKEERRK